MALHAPPVETPLMLRSRPSPVQSPGSATGQQEQQVTLNDGDC